MADGAEDRPGSAPGSKSGGAPAAAVPPRAPEPVDMSDLMERHLLENQKLREQLLYFTSKSSANKPKGKKGSSLSMPLPPV